MTLPLLARFLGPAEFGIYSLIFAATSAFSAATEFGLNQSIAITVNSNINSAKKNIYQYSSFKVLIGLVGMTAFLLISTIQKTKSTTIYISSCFLLIFIIMDLQNIIFTYWRAENKYFHELSAKAGINLSSSAAIILAAYITGKTLAVLNAFLVISLCSIPFVIYCFYKTKSYSKGDKIDIIFKNIGKLSLQNWGLGLFVVSFVNMDLFILSQTKSDATVGIYSAAQRILYIAQLPVAVFGQIIYQSMAGDFIKRSELWKKKLVYILLLLTMLGLFSSLLLFFASKYIVILIYGQNFIEAATILQRLSLGLLGLYIYPILSLIIVMVKKTNLAILTSIFLACTSFGLMKFALQYWGANGVALASSFMNLLIFSAYSVIVFNAIYTKEWRMEPHG